MAPTEGTAQAVEFLMGRFAGVGQGLQAHGMQGNGWAVCPDSTHRVKVDPHRDASLRTQFGGESLDRGVGVDGTIQAHHSAIDVGQLAAEPLGNGRRTGHLESHELVSCAGQLLFGGQKIARIGPQGCMAHSDDSRARRAVEAGNPLPAFPVLGHILAVVRIGTREDKRIDTLTTHHFPQHIHPFYDRFFHH